MATTTNRKFILLYIVLVGLPILAMFGVIKKGHSLTAPISVDGSWKVQGPAQSDLLCGKPANPDQDLTMAISQSGENFTFTVNGGAQSNLSGAISGTTLKVSGPPAAWPGAQACSDGHDFTLVATVDPKANPRSLEGTVSWNDCASCAPVSFRAVRQVPAEKGRH